MGFLKILPRFHCQFPLWVRKKPSEKKTSFFVIALFSKRHSKKILLSIVIGAAYFKKGKKTPFFKRNVKAPIRDAAWGQGLKKKPPRVFQGIESVIFFPPPRFLYFSCFSRSKKEWKSICRARITPVKTRPKKKREK